MADRSPSATTYWQRHAPALALFLALLSMAALSAPAAADQGASDRFAFAIIGDMPYDAAQRVEFVRLMHDVDAADLAFVVHTGDFWYDNLLWKDTNKGLAPCSNEVMDDRFGLAHASKHPFIYTPGDNDWTDCQHGYDPLETLARLRKKFFAGDASLGQHTLALERQSSDPRYPKYRENVRWVYGNVMFATLHMVGSNNNLGRTVEMDDEYTERNAADLEWMKEAFDLAARNGNKAIVLIAQANPYFENTWSAKLQKRYMLGGLKMKPPKVRRTTGFDDFLSELETNTLAFGKPVVYVHGDTHTFRVDKPLVGTASGRMIENFTRVENIGYKNTHWVRAAVDPDDPNVFTFELRIVDGNRAQH